MGEFFTDEQLNAMFRGFPPQIVGASHIHSDLSRPGAHPISHASSWSCHVGSVHAACSRLRPRPWFTPQELSRTT